MRPALKEALRAVQPELQRAAGKNVMHANTASRKVSRLAKRVKALGRSDGLIFLNDLIVMMKTRPLAGFFGFRNLAPVRLISDCPNMSVQ